MMITPVRMMLGFAGIAMLSAVTAIYHIPAPAAPITLGLTPKPDPAWASSFEVAMARKQDKIRTIELSKIEPVPVHTERVTVPADVIIPPVTPPDAKPVAKPVRTRHAESDVCSRHNMRKVSIRGGRSWRCRRSRA